MPSVIKNAFNERGHCSICKLSEIDTLNYGEIHCAKELEVHLFCLYFSSNLQQQGSEESGIVGFLFRDIRNLIKDCGEVECCYCNKKSATTYCLYPNCGRVFHQVCGFKVNARFEYLENFRTFCHLHNQIENENINYPDVNGCWICYEYLGDYHPVRTLPSCCGKWFHQQCLRKYAVNAGYSFMCPLCRNKNYGDFARRHGVYVPEYEALWEKTHDYRDIERFYTHCDANTCVCPKGRNFTNKNWPLQLCSCCGSYGFHKHCRPESERNDIIICKVCSNVQNNVENMSQAAPTLDQNLSLSPDVEANRNQSIIDLTQDDDEVLNDRIAIDQSDNLDAIDPSENLEYKRQREKAERPSRDMMRNFRISLWFRDYELYHMNK